MNVLIMYNTVRFTQIFIDIFVDFLLFHCTVILSIAKTVNSVEAPQWSESVQGNLFRFERVEFFADSIWLNLSKTGRTVFFNKLG